MPRDSAPRVIFIVTHPIQYFAPWFCSLAQRDDMAVSVIYLRHLHGAQQGVGFGTAFEWDVPLLSGYPSSCIDALPGWRGAAFGIWPLLRALRSACADVIVLTGWQEPLLALVLPLARCLGIAVIVRGESNAMRPRGKAASLVHRIFLRFANAVVTIGRSNREFYRRAGVRADRTFGGAYFVDNEHFLAMLARHGDTASGSVTDLPTPVTFAFCGKHVAFKRPDMLVEAAGKLVHQGMPVRLRFAGSGEMTAQLQARCIALGVEAEFVGFLNQTEMWRAYVGADVFVLPSTHRETWGLVANEAMLFGLPIIVSDQVGSGPDLVIHGQTGWVFSGGVDGLADAMRAAVVARDDLAAMGRQARKHVTAHYCMDVATAGLLDAVRHCLRRR